MSCKETVYIKLDKDIEVSDGETAFTIKKASFVTIDGNYHTISAARGSKKTMAIDIQSPNAIVRLVNLSLLNFHTATKLELGSNIYYENVIAIGSHKFLDGKGDNKVTFINSFIRDAKKVFAGGLYSVITLDNSKIFKIDKLLSAKGTKKIAGNAIDVDFNHNSGGLFSSDQEVKEYTFLSSKFTGGLKNGASLWSPSTTVTSKGLFYESEFIFEGPSKDDTSKSYLTNFPPISAPINRSLVFARSTVEADVETILAINGNTNAAGKDNFEISDNTFESNTANAIVSLINFAPSSGDTFISNNAFNFLSNSLYGNLKQRGKNKGIFVLDSTGITVVDNTLSNLTTAIEISSSINKPASQVFLGNNLIQNSINTIKNTSTETSGISNLLYANSFGASGEPLTPPEVVPIP